MLYPAPVKLVRRVIIEAGDQIERLEMEAGGAKLVQNSACEAIQDVVGQIDALASDATVDLATIIYQLTLRAAQGAARDATDEIVERLEKGKPS